MQEQESGRRVEAGTFRDAAFEGMHGSILFVGPQDKWRMEVDDGDITLRQGDGAADCVISCKERGELFRLVRGEQNLVTAILQGRISVEGDAMLAVQVAASMPSLREPEAQAGVQ